MSAAASVRLSLVTTTTGGFATAVGASVATAANEEGGIEPRGNRSIFTAIPNGSDPSAYAHRKMARLFRNRFGDGGGWRYSDEEGYARRATLHADPGRSIQHRAG